MITNFPVLGRRREPEINATPNKRDRPPDLDDIAHAGTRAAYRPDINAIPNTRERIPEVDSIARAPVLGRLPETEINTLPNKR